MAPGEPNARRRGRGMRAAPAPSCSPGLCSPWKRTARAQSAPPSPDTAGGRPAGREEREKRRRQAGRQLPRAARPAQCCAPLTSVRHIPLESVTAARLSPSRLGPCQNRIPKGSAPTHLGRPEDAEGLSLHRAAGDGGQPLLGHLSLLLAVPVDAGPMRRGWEHGGRGEARGRQVGTRQARRPSCRPAPQGALVRLQIRRAARPLGFAPLSCCAALLKAHRYWLPMSPPWPFFCSGSIFFRKTVVRSSKDTSAGR